MKEHHILLFHIGTMKTGTTSLQHFLYENIEILRDVGWDYPDFTKDLPEFYDKVKNEKSKNGIYFYGLDLKDGVDIKSEKWQKVWECIGKHLEERNVIISAEEMSIYGYKDILQEAKKRFKRVEVIVYFRRQDKLIESVWTQFMKMNLTRTFSEFLDSLNKGDESITDIRNLTDIKDSLFYYERICEIEEIIGVENLHIRVYEKEQFMGQRKDVISDFLYTMGINLAWDEIIEPMVTNERLGDGYTEIKRIFNKLDNTMPELQIQNKTYYLWQLTEAFREKKSETGYFTEEERYNFLKEFQEQNEMVAKKYLKRADGKLFYDNRIDYPKRLVQANSFEEDMIKTFAYIVFKENRMKQDEIDRLSYQNKLLVQNLILMLKGDRKLAYFGAGKRCFEMLEDYQLPVEIIFDNDRNKKGKQIFDVDVDIITDVDIENYFIFVTCFETDEIEQQLKGYGLQKMKDYIFMKEFI